MEKAPRNKYAQDYLDAVKLFQDDKAEKCIEAAKYNLTDPTLPRYHRMKNMMLISSVLDEWYEAERYRRTTEQLFHIATRLVPAEDEGGQKALEELRQGLDELKENQRESAPEGEDVDAESMGGGDVVEEGSYEYEEPTGFEEDEEEMDKADEGALGSEVVVALRQKQHASPSSSAEEKASMGRGTGSGGVSDSQVVAASTPLPPATPTKSAE